MAFVKIVLVRKKSTISEKSESHVDKPRDRQHNSGLFGRKRVITIGVMLVGLTIGAFLLLNLAAPTTHNSLPQKALAQVKDFTPYFFPNGDSADGFQLASANGITYSDSILFITLTNTANQTVTITEQSLPGDLAQSTNVVGDEPVTDVKGKAAIAHVGDRINGSMISQDHRTLITLTCSTTVGTDTAKDIMRSLSPIN